MGGLGLSRLQEKNLEIKRRGNSIFKNFKMFDNFCIVMSGCGLWWY